MESPENESHANRSCFYFRCVSFWQRLRQVGKTLLEHPGLRHFCDPARESRVMAWIYSLMVLTGFVAVLWMNRGHFTYLLDDPYIYLAVAEELAAHGHYGVNPQELSAPCSSPLWTFLLVPFAGLPKFALAPFFGSYLAGLATVIYAHRRVLRMLPAVEGDVGGSALRMGVTVFFILVTNLVGLVFTGMEHSLQVLLAVLVVEGLLRVSESEKPGLGFQIAIIVGPWIRYENMALTLAALGVLFLLGNRRQAMLLGGISALGLASFSGYLMSLGLAPMPASITAKSTFVGVDPFAAVLRNLKASLALGRGMLVALSVSVLLAMALVSQAKSVWRLVALSLAGAGFLHLIAGAYGWVNRYEIYILAALFWGIGGIAGILLKSHAVTLRPRLGLALIPLLPTLAFPYLQGLVYLPLACNNVYEQHYQMHRFATEYWKKPIAVNDLGYVCFENDQYILDLWGLASPQALKARMNHEPPNWISELAKQKNVKLAMLYEPWFPDLPKHWEKVAALRLSGKLVTPAWHEVTFYAMGAENRGELVSALEKFKKTLPRGVALDFF